MHRYILIIRPGAIGDALLTFPVIQALRTRYSNPHITLVSNPAVLPLARAFGLVEDVSNYGDLQWSELFSPFGIHSRSLRDLLQRSEHIICWLRDPDNVVAHNLSAVGVQHLTLAPGRPPENERVHIVDYLARTIGINDALLQEHAYTDAEEQICEPVPPIAIQPGSGGAYKCWPIEHFATVTKALWRRHIPVLLLTGPADTRRLADLLGQLASPSSPELLTLLSNAPLVEVAQRLQQCSGYVGNDSGITHLAALLGVPTLALFGPTDPVRWQPIGPRVNILYEPHLENLAPDTVILTIEKFILHNFKI